MCFDHFLAHCPGPWSWPRPRLMANGLGPGPWSQVKCWSVLPQKIEEKKCVQIKWYPTYTTTLRVIRSLWGRGGRIQLLWLSDLWAVAVTCYDHLLEHLLRSPAEIVCWDQLLRESVEFIYWVQLSRFLVEISWWDMMLKSFFRS